MEKNNETWLPQQLDQVTNPVVCDKILLEPTFGRKLDKVSEMNWVKNDKIKSPQD